MNGHAVIEISLGSAHLHGDAEALQDLVHGKADAVQTDHFFFRPDTDQLHASGLAMLCQGRIHGGELAAVHLHLTFAILGDGLRLGQAYGANGRVAEHHCGYQIVIKVLVRLVVEQPLREAATCGDGHRGQLDATRVVTNSIDVGDVGVLKLVGRDKTLVVQFDAGCCQAEIVGGWRAANGPDQAVDREVATIFQLQCQTVIGVLDYRLGSGMGVQFGPFLRHDLHQGLVDHGVEVTQRRVFANHQMGFAAEGLHHASNFDGDIASTDHGNPLGLRLQIEETIRIDTQFGAGNSGYFRAATGGDQYVIGRVLFTIDLDRVAIDEAGEAFDDCDLVFAQHILVGLMDAAYIGLAGLDQLGPAELIECGIEAVIGAIFQGIGDLACIPHGFLRYTTDVDAGSPQLFGFNQGNFFAVHGSPVRRGDTATAAADGDIVKMLCHCEILRSLRRQSQHDGDKAAGSQEPALSYVGLAGEYGTGRHCPVHWHS